LTEVLSKNFKVVELWEGKKINGRISTESVINQKKREQKKNGLERAKSEITPQRKKQGGRTRGRKKKKSIA